MASVEERLSYLEGRMQEQSVGFVDLRGLITEVAAELRGSIRRLDERIDTLDQKMSRQFLWLAGFQLTTLLAIIGFLGRLTFP